MNIQRTNIGRARHSVRAVCCQPMRSAGRGLPALPVLALLFVNPIIQLFHVFRFLSIKNPARFPNAGLIDEIPVGFFTCPVGLAGSRAHGGDGRAPVAGRVAAAQGAGLHGVHLAGPQVGDRDVARGGKEAAAHRRGAFHAVLQFIAALGVGALEPDAQFAVLAVVESHDGRSIRGERGAMATGHIGVKAGQRGSGLRDVWDGHDGGDKLAHNGDHDYAFGFFINRQRFAALGGGCDGVMKIHLCHPEGGHNGGQAWKRCCVGSRLRHDMARF